MCYVFKRGERGGMYSTTPSPLRRAYGTANWYDNSNDAPTHPPHEYQVLGTYMVTYLYQFFQLDVGYTAYSSYCKCTTPPAIFTAAGESTGSE